MYYKDKTIKDKNSIVKKVARYVYKALNAEGTGHDWWHIDRVWKTAKNIAAKEKNADMFVVELSALLHDIAGWKFHKGDEGIGPRTAKKLLQRLKVDDATIERVGEIIKGISFKGAHVNDNMRSIEGKIVQDADRLDALGAIGIARAFAYGGYKGKEIYNPTTKPRLHRTFKQYKKSDGPTINHFYEKLLLLKGRMHTSTAKKIAHARHKFMEEYLDGFYKEWNGKM